MHALRDLVRSASSSTVGILSRTLGHVVSALDDVIYPPHCLLTGRPLDVPGSSFAPRVDDLPLVSREGLDACDPAPSPTELMLTLQRHIEADDIALSSAHAIWGHAPDSDIGKLIYAIKYKGHSHLALALGRRLGHYYSHTNHTTHTTHTIHTNQTNQTNQTLLTPVPIHNARLRERGYNQAELIARGMSEVLGFPVVNALRRTRNVASQTTLSEKERLANVQGIFEIDPGLDRDILKGASVVVVDDVLTTGATLNNCAWTLLDGGARRVDAAAICATV